MANESATPRRVRVERNIYRWADGAFEIGFRDAAGRQRWRTVAGGISAARAARDELLVKRHRGEQVDGNRPLRFADAAEHWIAGPVQDLRPRTIECYTNALKQHLFPRFGAQRLDAISPDDLAELVRALRRQGLSESTGSIAIGVTNRVYCYAARRLGWSGSNPVSLLLSPERPKPSQAKRRRIFRARNSSRPWQLRQSRGAPCSSLPHSPAPVCRRSLV